MFFTRQMTSKSNQARCLQPNFEGRMGIGEVQIDWIGRAPVSREKTQRYLSGSGKTTRRVCCLLEQIHRTTSVAVDFCDQIRDVVLRVTQHKQHTAKDCETGPGEEFLLRSQIRTCDKTCRSLLDFT
jgi:hypothetical protein